MIRIGAVTLHGGGEVGAVKWMMMLIMIFVFCFMCFYREGRILWCGDVTLMMRAIMIHNGHM